MRAASVAKEIDGRRVRLYEGTGANLPVVYDIEYQEAGAGILEASRACGCRPFHLVTISGVHWTEELSPWPTTKLVSPEGSFAGRADMFRELLEQEVVPFVQDRLPDRPSFQCLAGYSLAGLFAMYMMYHTSCFSHFISASGSLWYPGFMSYAAKQALAGRPAKVYLSIGDRESRTKHAWLKTTEDNTRQLAAMLQAAGIPSRFVLNPGGHFRQPQQRLAAGIKWSLTDEDGMV
jgi:predicted alpha/beta superfamily hydrolase